MTATTFNLHADVDAYEDALRMPAADLVDRLRAQLGAKLVAYIAGVQETRAVRQWAEGLRTPSPETLERLRKAYTVAVLLRQRDSDQVVQAWFMGMNPRLDDVAPARLFRERPLDEAWPAVIAAARAFVSNG